MVLPTWGCYHGVQPSSIALLTGHVVAAKAFFLAAETTSETKTLRDVLTVAIKLGHHTIVMGGLT